MKPARVYPRDNSFLIQYYVAGRTTPLQERTGLPLDVDVERLKAKAAAKGKKWSVKDDPEWWHASQYAKTILNRLKRIEQKRIAIKLGRAPEPNPLDPATLPELLGRINKEANTTRRYKKGELSEQTIRRRAASLAQLLRYDPHATIESINDLDWIEGYSQYLKKKLAHRSGKPLTDWTQKSYIADVKLLTAFASKRDMIVKDRLAEVEVGRGHTKVVHTDIDLEFESFRYLAEHNRAVCEQLLHLRLGGFRASDSFAFKTEWIDFKHGRFYPYNVKGRREEGFPITTSFEILFKHLTGYHDGYAYKYQNYNALYQMLRDTLVDAPKLYVPMHNLKRNYTHEIEEEENLPKHIFGLLKHHASVGITESYTGRNVDLMGKWLNKIQSHFPPFLREILA